MHEIITLQFGQQANYIGTHFWNTQESYFPNGANDESPVDHGISFRSGLGTNGQETYTPRAIIYDLQPAFGTLRRENALYQLDQQETGEQALGWNGRTVPLRLPRIEPSAYQTALDRDEQLPPLGVDTVRFWSDYNHVFYHPRSIIPINEFQVNGLGSQFERHDTGVELFERLDRAEEFIDRDFRPFLEECDQVAGIQILTGLNDAWGGFSASYLEHVEEHIGKRQFWVFGAHQDGQRQTRQGQAMQDYNTAQAIASMSSKASAIVPLDAVPISAPPYLHMNNTSPWHTSALQAAFIESSTLPTRLNTPEDGQARFDTLETTLNLNNKRNIFASSMSLRRPLRPETTPAHMTNGSGRYRDEDHVLDISLFPVDRAPLSIPRRTSIPQVFSCVETLRGRWMSHVERRAVGHEQEERFVRGGALTRKYLTPLLYPVLPSSPPIFTFENGTDYLRVKTALSTSSIVARRLRGLQVTTRSMIGLEEREALSETLLTIAEEYDADDYDESEEMDDDE